MRGDGSRTGGWGRFFATWLQLGGGGGGDSAGFEEFLSRSGRSEEQKGGAEDDDAQFCGCEEGWNARSAGASGVADDGAEGGARGDEGACVGADDGVKGDPWGHAEDGTARDGAHGHSSQSQEVVGDREWSVREEAQHGHLGGLHDGIALAADGSVHLLQLRSNRSASGSAADALGDIIAELSVTSGAATEGGQNGRAHHSEQTESGSVRRTKE